ncbi:MAG: thioredoxin domain-containing protein, partial [Chloroflexi bacterium]|nr:thioredoxin domain-containing protein [Chloroflexota bacterium]
EQGKFWDYHHVLYTVQNGRNYGTFGKENLKRYAGQLSLDQGSFDSCLDSGRYTKQVQEDTEAGRQKGVQRTPTLIINGHKIEGVPTFDQLKSVIEQRALAPAPAASGRDN